MHSLKDELNIYKEKLFFIEKQLQAEISKVAEKDKIWAIEEETINNIIKEKGSTIISFNVSGKYFKTKLSTLVSLKETLFYRMILNSKDEINKIIYFDRDPFYFEILLNYMRYKTIDYSRFNQIEKKLLLIESEFFEIKDLVDHLNGHLFDVELFSFEFNAPYLYQGKKAGTNLIDDLSDKSLMKGICANSPGNITFELSGEYRLRAIMIGGYNGNNHIWNKEHGSGATISLSTDKITWINIGTVPVGFGSDIKTVNITEETKGKYLKFSSTSHLGIGYLKLIV